MIIVHIITRLIVGGAQENTLITCREQAEAGHKVYLITGASTGREGAMFTQAQAMGFETIVVKQMFRAIKPFSDIVAFFKLRKLLKEIKPDVVHTHSAKAGILGRLAAWGIKGSYKPQSDDYLPKNSSKKLPMVVHTIHGLAFHDYQSRLVNKFYIAVERFTAKRCDAIITVADTMRDKALAAQIGTAKMFTTAYSAIDTKLFLEPPTETEIKNFRRKNGISDQSRVNVCVARLAELKGHEYIIESAKKLSAQFPDAMWLFVGDGDKVSEIKSKISLASLAHKIRLTGLLKPEAIPLAIHSSDILVHCSLREGLARVLPQAMLCGKPVVSFDIDGAKEVVNDSTGRLIAPGDVEAVVEACRRLLSDKNLCRRLGTNGREQVRRIFAPDVMTDTIQKVYNSFLQ